MDHYRIVARSIWNVGFWSQPDLRNWDSWDEFQEINKLLFNALVIPPSELTEGSAVTETDPFAALLIVPSSPTVPIMIHRPREGDRNNYWDDPVREVTATDAELHFLDYFDWDLMNYIDFQYYRVRIAKFASQPHLVGRDALLEHHQAKVFLNSE